MSNVIATQAYLFIVYAICGVIIGVFFDIFRILRKSFKTTDFITYIEDIIFGLFTGVFLIFMLFVFNNGQLRFYIFLAILLGLLLYMATISKYLIKVCVKIIVTFKNIVIKIISVILYPIKKIMELLKEYVLKLILKPFRILIINIKKVQIINPKAKNNKHKNKEKPIKQKKDKKIQKNVKLRKDFIK